MAGSLFVATTAVSSAKAVVLGIKCINFESDPITHIIQVSTWLAQMVLELDRQAAVGHKIFMKN
jgi:hypothetical protein